MIVDGSKLTADAGMALTNGTVYATVVYLSPYDRAENWREVHESDIPPDPDPDVSQEERMPVDDALRDGLVQLTGEADNDFLNEREPEPDYFA